MTEIREQHYSIDLPGEWEKAESLEETDTVYREKSGKQTMTVTLLGVRPMYQIAEEKVLLQQYMDHRKKFEKGKSETLEQSETAVEEIDGTVEGSWSAHDPESGRIILHRILLRGNMLADFRFVAFDLAPDEFADRASQILASISVSNE